MEDSRNCAAIGRKVCRVERGCEFSLSLLLLRVRGGHKFKRDRIGDGLQRVCVGMRKAILLIER